MKETNKKPTTTTTTTHINRFAIVFNFKLFSYLRSKTELQQKIMPNNWRMWLCSSHHKNVHSSILPMRLCIHWFVCRCKVFYLIYPLDGSQPSLDSMCVVRAHGTQSPVTVFVIVSNLNVIFTEIFERLTIQCVCVCVSVYIETVCFWLEAFSAAISSLLIDSSCSLCIKCHKSNPLSLYNWTPFILCTLYMVLWSVFNMQIDRVRAH